MSEQKHKKSLLVLATIAIILIFILGTVVAYVFDVTETLNILKIGRFKPTQESVQIILMEEEFRKQIESKGSKGGYVKYYKDDSARGDVSEALLADVLPGQGINKDPTIKNVGEEEVYLRMRVYDKEGNDIFENPFFTGDATQPGLGLKREDYWVKVGPYYYYQVSGKREGAGSLLDVNDTLAIFSYHFDPAAKTSMQIPLGWDYTDFAGKDIDIYVQVQAIQYRYFDPNLALDDPWDGAEGPIMEFTL